MNKIKSYILMTIATFIVSLLSVQAQTPGGISSATPVVWLTPDTYNSGTWTNKVSGTVGNFILYGGKTPNKISSGYNFHPSVEFPYGGSANPSRANSYMLQSQNGYSTAAGENITIVFVLNRSASNHSYDHLFAFRDAFGNGAISWYLQNNLSWTWSTTRRNVGTYTNPTDAGIIVLDNANDGSNGINSYHNGVYKTNVATTSQALSNMKMAIASGENDQSYYPYEGTIQEIIILKANAPNKHLTPEDLQKLHSYLSIKYGITLATGDYVNSAGVSIWTRGTGYDTNIFGIERDDALGLHQVQSRSVTNNLTTLFVGDKVENLNSTALLNGASLPNGTYVMLGSNGLVNPESTNIGDDEEYENGRVNATNGLNIRSKTIYRAEVTGQLSIQVNLKVAVKDYMYVFVSDDNSFPPLTTRIYPINSDGIATGVELKTGDYIRYAGYAMGPGGIGVTNLRLWLRADDEGSLGLRTLPESSTELAGHPAFAAGTTEAEAVDSWADPIRNQTYLHPSTSGRVPIYERSSPLTNFHPAVRFWTARANGTTAYLSNTATNLTNNKVPPKHTSYFLVNNSFTNNFDWVYPLMFGSADLSSFDGPGYGVEKTGSGSNYKVVGRFRTNSTAGSGNENLFNPGSTSILGYYVSYGGTNTGANNTVRFRFNGLQNDISNPNTYTLGNMSMQQSSVLGSGYQWDRTLNGVMAEAIILEQEITPDEQVALESYMAIKYGITLRPSTTSTNRFDYLFSNRTAFFPGNSSTDPKYTTYYNNIGAVIRDNASGLYNQQAHSTNAGSLLHVGVAGTGSAGTSFGKNTEFGELNDLEALVWGSDGVKHVSPLPKEDCADFDWIFDGKWFIRKITESNRPLSVIIGAENNKGNSLGSDGSTDQVYYDRLTTDYNVFLAVADNPNDLKAESFNPKVVLPMSYINGEHQCLYTFAELDTCTYITFGYRSNKNGCPRDVEFTGTKTLDWSKSWTSKNYNLNGSGKVIPNAAGYTDNLDEITATTKITYDNGVRAGIYYPRFTSSPKGGLDIRRNRGTVNSSKVTVTITFDHPVIPSFSISGLDSRYRQYDVVSISGSCTGVSNIIPTLTYAGRKQDALYKISGGEAQVNKNRTASTTENNGKVNVTFGSGIKEVTIEYTIANHVYGSTDQQIFISPVSIRNVPPIAPVNEDGFSFTKQVKESEITTCEQAEYSFFIGNTNFTNKYIEQFRDTLPANMKWVIGAVGLDTINADVAYNPHLKINYETTDDSRHVLIIDSLFIPCTSVTQVMATAMFEDGAPSDNYLNRAAIKYEHIRNSTSYYPVLQSVDRDMPSNPYTTLFAEMESRSDTVRISTSLTSAEYAAGREVLVTLTLTNNNADIGDMFLDVNWDAGFTYNYDSPTYNNAAGSKVYSSLAEGDTTNLRIAGNVNEETGFTLPTGKTTFTFKLKAPVLSELEPMYDEDGILVPDQKATLHIGYNFTSEDDNPCVIENLSGLSGEIKIPYRSVPSHIIVNKHVTPMIMR